MTETNKLVPPPSDYERGPNERGEKWSVLSDDERMTLDTMKAEDFRILNTVMPRLWHPMFSVAEPELVLEVIAGPYRGVLFNVSNFEIKPVDVGNGMVPVKFETKIYKAPADFTHDEKFDYYARDIFLAWLLYIQTHDLRKLQASEPPTDAIH